MKKNAEFEKTALPHLHHVFSFAYKLTGNRQDAEDLTQEAFLKAFASFDSFRKGTNMKAWLFTITVNSYINIYRRRIKCGSILGDPSSLAQVIENLFSVKASGTHGNPPAIIELSEARRNITSLINCLPENFKTIIILADIEEFTYKEIAEILHIPAGTVMSRLFRARNMLRKTILECKSGINALSQK